MGGPDYVYARVCAILGEEIVCQEEFMNMGLHRTTVTMNGFPKDIFAPVASHDRPWDDNLLWWNEDIIHFTMRYEHPAPFRGFLARVGFDTGGLLEVLVIEPILHGVGLNFIFVHHRILFNDHLLFNRRL
jgi:hypothetical protein